MKNNNKKQKNMENKNFNFCLKVPDKISFSVPQNIEFFNNKKIKLWKTMKI